ncbi:hypothetical protein V8J88_15965 [Massilia sp. W12]|uniref:hypothetical protein n=1 Tax=Massilia sp. W12 TaxID=3126507 RepID=UPI0030D4D808
MRQAKAAFAAKAAPTSKKYGCAFATDRLWRNHRLLNYLWEGLGAPDQHLRQAKSVFAAKAAPTSKKYGCAFATDRLWRNHRLRRCLAFSMAAELLV